MALAVGSFTSERTGKTETRADDAPGHAGSSPFTPGSGDTSTTHERDATQ